MSGQLGPLGEPLDRFRLNLGMTAGLLWVALAGACTASFLWFALSDLLWARQDRMGAIIFLHLALPIGAAAVLPGVLIWRLARRRLGFLGPSDNEHVLWRVARIIGIAWAIALWGLGCYLMLGQIHDRAFLRTADWQLALSIVWIMFLYWLPGWLMYWASRRPSREVESPT